MENVKRVLTSQRRKIPLNDFGLVERKLHAVHDGVRHARLVQVTSFPTHRGEAVNLLEVAEV